MRTLARQLRRRTRLPAPAEWALVRLGLRHVDARPFVVVSRARSGSNLLISALRSHPQVHVEGELLRRLGGADVDDVLTRVFGSSRRRRVSAVGFKMFYYHPLDGDSGAAWDRLASVDGMHFVHLRRRNRLRALVSRRIAQQTQVWVHIAGSNVAHERAVVELAPRDAMEFFERAVAQERTFEDRFSGRPMLDVYYEDLVTDLDGEVSRVVKFLGLREARVRPRTERQNPQPLSALIANYDELEAALRHTPWGEYLDS